MNLTLMWLESDVDGMESPTLAQIVSRQVVRRLFGVSARMLQDCPEAGSNHDVKSGMV